MDDRIRRGNAPEPPVAEWARSEARDLADTARQRMDEVKTTTKDYTSEAKEYVHGAVQQTKEYVEGARDYVGGAMQQARDKMSAYREGGVEKVKHDLVSYTREQPMTALLIAAGAGLLLGWLSAVGRR